jgi:hypothetical protein
MMEQVREMARELSELRLLAKELAETLVKDHPHWRLYARGGPVPDVLWKADAARLLMRGD